MRKIKLITLTLCLSAALSFTSFAAQWSQDSSGWWYQNDDGSYPVSVLKQIERQWYYFDANGYMITGWLQFSDGWYEFRQDGSCANPLSTTTGIPVGAPAQGWISFNSTLPSLVEHMQSGKVVFHNNMYWASPELVSNLKELAERDIVVRKPQNTLTPDTKVEFNRPDNDDDWDDDDWDDDDWDDDDWNSDWDD